MRGSQIDLIGNHGKAANGDQARRFIQHTGRHLGARADAKNARFLQLFDQCVFIKRRRQAFNILIPGAPQRFDGAFADPFEQQDLDFLFGQRRILNFTHGDQGVLLRCNVIARPQGQFNGCNGPYRRSGHF